MPSCFQEPSLVSAGLLSTGSCSQPLAHFVGGNSVTGEAKPCPEHTSASPPWQPSPLLWLGSCAQLKRCLAFAPCGSCISTQSANRGCSLPQTSPRAPAPRCYSALFPDRELSRISGSLWGCQEESSPVDLIIKALSAVPGLRTIAACFPKR